MKQTTSIVNRVERFAWSRVLKISDIKENQLYRMLDALNAGSPFNNQALAIVDETIEKNGHRQRPILTLKAVAIPKALWDTEIAAHSTIPLTYDAVEFQDDFLLTQDRIWRVVQRLAPIQDLRTFKFEVPAAGATMHMGFAFVDATLHLSPALTPTAVDGAAGTLAFSSGDAGIQVVATAVTAPHYLVAVLTRVEPQPVGSHLPSMSTDTRPWGVLVHPSLAATLGVTLPSF